LPIGRTIIGAGRRIDPMSKGSVTLGSLGAGDSAMRKVRITVLAFAVVAVGVVGFAVAAIDSRNLATVIEVDAAIDFISKHEDAVVLDVRRPIEFQQSHIVGAINVPVQDEAFEDMVAKLDPNNKYIVHCTKNIILGRTDRALRTMKRLGFKHLYNLKGGHVAWQEASLPLTETSN
jgi:rhodanese-related sulfurtransferase